MPRSNRPNCVACGRTIRSSKVRFLSTNRLRLFVSIEHRKRVTSADAICDACRLKYVDWRKITMGDFDQLDDNIGVYSQSDVEFNENDDVVILI